MRSQACPKYDDPVRIPRSPGAAGWRRTALVLLLVVLSAVAARRAWGAYDAGSPGAYLRYGSSARTLALGGASAGLGGDVATAYWNPAGLSQLRNLELTAMGATLFEDTKYSFVALGMPAGGKGTIAFSGTFVSSGEFERTGAMIDLGETFKETEGVFALSYARGNYRYGWGVTGKSVSQEIDGYSGSGMGVDVGAYLRPNHILALGLSVQNVVAPEITLNETPEKLARTVRGGVALHLVNGRVLALGDLLKTEFMDPKFQAGVEAWPLRNVVMRGGYDSLREEYSFGGGVRYQNWQLDYAYLSHELGGTSILSATMRFGVPDGVHIRANRERFSPAGNERSVSFDVRTAVNGRVRSWRLDIVDGEGNLVRSLSGVGEPLETVTWGGEDENGRLVGIFSISACRIVLWFLPFSPISVSMGTGL